MPLKPLTFKGTISKLFKSHLSGKDSAELEDHLLRQLQGKTLLQRITMRNALSETQAEKLANSITRSVQTSAIKSKRFGTKKIPTITLNKLLAEIHTEKLAEE